MEIEQDPVRLASSPSISLRSDLVPNFSSPFFRVITIMTPPHPHLRAAAPIRKIFDPWNSSSKGHQFAENRIGASIGWRNSRARKLQQQLGGGLANGGGERMYDLVGQGAVDEGVGYFMEKKGKEVGNKRIDRSGRMVNDKDSEEEGTEFALSGAEMEWLQKGSKREQRKAAEKVGRWDGRVREEAICLKTRGRKRASEDSESVRPLKESRIESGSQTLKPELPLGVEVDDSDEIWDDLGEEVSEAPVTTAVDDQLWDETLESEDEAISPVPTKRLSIQQSAVAAIVSNRTPHTRPTSPPSGQTSYALPARSPPPTKFCSSTSRLAHILPTNPSTSSLLLQEPMSILRGLTIHVTGPTLPLIGDHALRQLLVAHGATVALHMARRSVTHVVMGCPNQSGRGDGEGAGGMMAGSKLDREMRRLKTVGGPGVRFVSVQWVLASVKAGKRLGEAQFGVGMLLPDDDAEDEGKRKPVRSQVQPSKAGIRPSGPLTAVERAGIGVDVVDRPASGPGRGRGTARRGDPQKGPTKARAVSMGVGKGLMRATAMPGAPPGVPSVRSMFLKQHRDNAWKKAGFTRK